MIKLSEVFDFGKVPFADPSDKNIYNKKSLDTLLKKQGYEEEKNTQDEKRFLAHMRQYMDATAVGGDGINLDDKGSEDVILAGYFQELLKIKNQFPTILDPATTSSKYVYRGTTMNIETFLSLQPIQKGDVLTTTQLIDVPAKGTRGWFSFTTNKKIAQGFKGKGSIDMIPTTLVVPVQSSNLILSSNFTRTIPEFEEAECIYVGNSIKAVVYATREDFQRKVNEISTNTNYKEVLSKIEKLYGIVPKEEEEEENPIYKVYTAEEKIEEYIKNGSKGNLMIVANDDLRELPTNLIVRGNLNLVLCKNLKSLPQGLNVEGTLEIYGSGVENIPTDIKVRKKFSAGGTPFSKKYTKKEIKDMYPGIQGTMTFN